MKTKVTAKMFFTVLWRGLCQALGWFFGLFGYKRDGRFAKCVWGVFAVSCAIFMALLATVGVMSFWHNLSYYTRQHECKGAGCYRAKHVARTIYFHEGSGADLGYVFDAETGRKCIRDVEWIAKPEAGDSLVCYSNGKKRGYFNMYTGEVVVAPRYNHAWIFSEGLAAVEEKGFITFIDATGRTVIDHGQSYLNDDRLCLFSDGYCCVCSETMDKWGMIDRTGALVIPEEYDRILLYSSNPFIKLCKGDTTIVLDRALNPVLTLPEGDIYICDDATMIDVTLPDHTMRKYDLKGRLIYDFYISDLRTLTYNKDEILYRDLRNGSDDGSYYTTVDTYHPEATARLRAYAAGDGYEGLMTADGHRITMPLYQNIDAIDYDLYLCTVSNGDKVIVNGRGERVE